MEEPVLSPKLVLLLASSIVVGATAAAISLVLGWGWLLALVIYTCVGSATLLLLGLWLAWREIF